LQQHTAQLTEKYDHLSVEYTQLKAAHAQIRAEYAQQKMDHKQLRKMVMTWHHRVEPVRLILFGRITTSVLLLLLQLHLYINL